MKQSYENGSALVLVVVAAVILSFLGLGLLSVGWNKRISAIRAAQAVEARVAADAGLAKALYQINLQLTDKGLNEDLFPYAVDEPLPYTDATMSYEVGTEIFGDSSDDDEYVYIPDGHDGMFEYDEDADELEGTYLVVSSVGQSGPVVKRVRALLKLKGLFDKAIVVKDQIVLMPGTYVGGYNSEDPTDTDVDVDIGTTSTEPDRISIGPGTVIDADVFIGVGGDPEVVIGSGGTINGQKYALTQEVYFPPVKPPELTYKGPLLYAKGTTVKLTSEDSGQYGAVALATAAGNAGVLEIAAGDVVLHITGGIDLGNSCEIVVADGASLTLYVDGNIATKNGAGFANANESPSQFRLFATGDEPQTFDLKAKTDVFGVIYAPEAYVELYPAGVMRGAIVADTFVTKSRGTLLYDEQLKKVSLDDIGAHFQVLRWYEDYEDHED